MNITINPGAATDDATQIDSIVSTMEENMQFLDDDLSNIQDELFEEVSFDDLSELEDEYVEIKCENCNKPLFVEQQALNNNNNIPCPFCGSIANK